jgi:hypothetical protein
LAILVYFAVQKLVGVRICVHLCDLWAALCASVVQTIPSLTGFAVFLGRIRLEPLAEKAEHSRNQVEGDDHQHNDE